MVPEAVALKDHGNKLFSQKDYAGAESYYSRAIILDPTISTLYTNRAMCRLNLSRYDDVVSDCTTCLSLDPKNSKANYIMSKALLELRCFDAACKCAKLGYDLAAAAAVTTGGSTSKNVQVIHDWLITCKTRRWEEMERRRVREAAALEREVVEILEQRMRDDAAAAATGSGEEKMARDEGEKRIESVKAIFERARREDDRKREVPPWLVDDISFNVMVDPVTTNSGHSYERSSIVSALSTNPIDPITREPFTVDELRPNRGLKEACEWFLDKNGWAYNW